MHRLWINLWTSGAYFLWCVSNTAEQERVFVQKCSDTVFREHYVFHWKGSLWMICGKTVDNYACLVDNFLKMRKNS